MLYIIHNHGHKKIPICWSFDRKLPVCLSFSQTRRVLSSGARIASEQCGLVCKRVDCQDNVMIVENLVLFFQNRDVFYLFCQSRPSTILKFVEIYKQNLNNSVDFDSVDSVQLSLMVNFLHFRQNLMIRFLHYF